MRRGLALACLLIASNALAAGGARPRFEPTDLELDDPGVLDIDVQLGPMKGQGPWRLVTPDFELDLGITREFELDLDGAYAFEGVDEGMLGSTFLDHAAPDNLWLSAKLGLLDLRDEQSGWAWAIGVQVGPKLPVANDATGIGFEGLVLIGRMMGQVHLVLNLGGLVDPGTAGGPRPVGLEGGLDVDIDLVKKGTWSFLAEVGGVYYLSDDAHQLSATAGIQWSPNDKLDISVVGLVGFLSGSDQYGVLIGFSPKIKLW